MTQTTSPDRTLPQQLIDLAVLAIHRGAERVSLRHEGPGADFPAPIGWLLTFHMEDDPARPEKKRSAFFVHQVGCDLDDIVAPDWLRDEPEAPTVDELVQLFQTGARNEWEVTYVRDYLERSVMNSLAEEYPESTALAKFGMRHRLEAQAHNWGYDDAAAARGDRISTTLLLSVRESGNPDVIAFADDGGTHRQVDQAHVAGLLRQTAPNATPVAYYAGDEDGWVLCAAASSSANKRKDTTMGRLILEYRDGGITRIERPVKADRLQIHDVERHHLADALHVAGQQLVNAAGLDNGGGTDPAKRLLAAFQGAAADANVNLPERFLLTLADIAVTELPLIR